MSDSHQYADVSAMFTGKAKRRYLDVHLPVKDITLRIQSLMAGEVSRFQSATISTRRRKLIQSKLEDSLARLIVLCVVDANGTRILSDDHVPQIVEEWDNADVAYLSDICSRHSGIDPEELEDLAKNSGGISFDSENSESPDNTDA